MPPASLASLNAVSMPSRIWLPSSLAAPVNGAEMPNRTTLSVTPRMAGALSFDPPTYATRAGIPARLLWSHAVTSRYTRGRTYSLRDFLSVAEEARHKRCLVYREPGQRVRVARRCVSDVQQKHRSNHCPRQGNADFHGASFASSRSRPRLL